MRGELLEADRVHSIVGAFFRVYNYYGFGLNESIYSGALEYELGDRGHDVARELAVPISYRGRHVAWQRLDMVVDNRVVVENKATENLSPAASRQLLSYLRATRFEVGVLLHFGPSPKFERFIDSPKHRAIDARSEQDDTRMIRGPSTAGSTDVQLEQPNTNDTN